jgi:serine/threonine protein kinase
VAAFVYREFPVIERAGSDAMGAQQTPLIASFGRLTPIGRGAFAHVYRGYDETFNRDVAIKVLDRSQLGDDGLRRFERECRAIGAVSAHPKIVTVYSSGTTPDGAPYIVMDLMHGSLTDVLDRDGTLPWTDAVAIGADIAGAVQAAHDEGILHRDIKPDNILVSRYGHAQLADFGISSIFDSTMGARDAVTASVAHAAPEVLEGRRATPASDVYSLASTMVAMIRGRAPFSQSDDERVAAVISRIRREQPPRLAGFGVTPDLQAVLDRAMAKDPVARYVSAVDFAAALGDFRPRMGESRSLLTSPPPPGAGASRPQTPEPPQAPAAPAAPIQVRRSGLIPGGSLIPGGQRAPGAGLSSTGSTLAPAESTVPPQADPVGGSNRLPVNPARAGLIPAPVVEEPADAEPMPEVLRADAIPADVEPVEVEPVEISGTAGETQTETRSNPTVPPGIRVLTVSERPVLDPRDPLLMVRRDDEIDDADDSGARGRRLLLAVLGGVVVVGGGVGTAIALSGGHHQAPVVRAATTTAPVVQQTPVATPTTAAPIAPVATTISATPHLAIATLGSDQHPTVKLHVSSAQASCVAGSAALQQRVDGNWHNLKSVPLSSSGTVSAAVTHSGHYRWLLPARTPTGVKCGAATSSTDVVTVAPPASSSTSSATGTSTGSTTVTPPSSSGGSHSSDPRNNAPVKPGG